MTKGKVILLCKLNVNTNQNFIGDKFGNQENEAQPAWCYSENLLIDVDLTGVLGSYSEESISSGSRQ